MLSWANVDFGPDEPLAWLIGQAQTEARVDLHLVGGTGGSHGSDHFSQCPHN
jgi:hypothetical protein